MLNFVIGRNNSKKTEYIRNLIADGVKQSESEYIFIVPEQFSYETERAMLEKVGAKDLLRVEVISLSRLAEVILREKGVISQKQPVDDGIKMLTMSLALEALSDRLKIFRKYITRPALIENLVSFATEMKQCSVSVDMLGKYVENSENNSLKSKLEELILIISLYNSMLEKEYYNSDDSFDLLYDLFNSYRFFENKTVVIDGFTRFTKQESKIIEKAVSQSENVYITFTTDKSSFYDDYSVFANINKQIESLKKIADKCNVKTANPIVVDECAENISEELLILEKNIFKSSEPSETEMNPKGIIVAACPNKADECEFVAQSIKRLMREDEARCRDIIVYERSQGSYDRQLAAAFKKYGIPFFEDKRQPLDNQPLIIYIKSLFDIACNGLSTETVLRYLKTDLTGMTAEEISQLENYGFIWKLKPSQWQNDFTENPRGFGSELNDFDKQTLEKLNELRRKAVAPVLAFKRDFTNAAFEQKTVVLYEFLEKNGIREEIKKIAKKLYDSNNRALCEEQETVWTLVTEMLDKLYIVSKQADFTDKRYSELFDILLCVSDFGVLPRGLDEVTLAIADRTRTSMKKYVFILGANEGVFPLCPSTQGLLNDKDRITLRNAGIELAQTAEYKQIEEKFIAYSAVTSAKKRLYVSYSDSDYNGTSKTASEIVSEIKSIFPSLSEIRYEQIDALDKIESDYSAFEVLAENYKQNSSVTRTLEEYFSANELFKGRVESLKNALKSKKLLIEDKTIAVDLFGKDINLSASKIQTYYECPFKYFCRYGIKAEPIKQAEIDPLLSGTVIHEIFEIMLGHYSKQELAELSDEKLIESISQILDNFLCEKMGGREGKTKRFIQQYNALGIQAFNIFKRIIEEMKISDFVPVDFELRIGRDSEILPYTLRLSDNGSITVSGSVDRVDTMDKNGKKYLRVVDYKSGGKTFKLCDVFEGLSTQMLIYLFAIEKNGKMKYGEVIPSGILYMSAKPEAADLPRNADTSEIEAKRLKKNKMSGMVLDDVDVIEGMENGIGGLYIPARMKKDGSITGRLISEKNLKKLNREIDKVLINMGNSVHNGKIEVLPVDESKCDNCDYKSVCHFEDGDAVRVINEMTHEQAIEKLETQGDESDE